MLRIDELEEVYSEQLLSNLDTIEMSMMLAESLAKRKQIEMEDRIRSTRLRKPSSADLNLLEQENNVITHINDSLYRSELSDSMPNKAIAESIEPDTSLHELPSSMLEPLLSLKAYKAISLAPGIETKDCGRKPFNLRKEKSKRPPLSDPKARLRNYERRSRYKREHILLNMRKIKAATETQIRDLCINTKCVNPLVAKFVELSKEATLLANHNYELRKAIEKHVFFHLMLQLEYDHREITDNLLAEKLFPMLDSWRPLDETMCHRLMRDSFLEIEAFSNSQDFIANDLELCGWHEKRMLVGTNVNFMFHKHFAKNCSDDLAARSWAMRVEQDQVTRYFGHSLNVKVKVLQRYKNDVVVVRRKMKHMVDGWVHNTIYLLFRTKTSDGHIVCIRDMNPENVEGLHVLTGYNPSQSGFWSKAFVWWKFRKLPKVKGQRIRGFEVEYGGSLSSATSADAAFWMREVLVLALRWENLVVGPLLTLH
ncbi:uncharacterized protein PHALS_01112 [Plasmopara halstedii]|uniref:Uncharacterized protein n=1 Tax=Plasmopara halstedii TaxID=4781 RepID=A0A0P1AW57_PLAHL|nr:uncharacterized protein PHALS_01112 [Plasmopara halstedii]CEG44774.1 hypothetical protein PHALS_01112 [Plasmopara halstedii]|eukprot:XP_024581143.1 hypothetical protein PHALS_01112 [Plasmopara halstedii]